MSDEPVSFVDAESDYSGFGKKEEISFRAIVMSHLKKISDFSCVELRGGFFQDKAVGQCLVRVYVPDSREVLCNSIDFLSDLLCPHYDSAMKDAEAQCEKELENQIKELKQLKEASFERYLQQIRHEKVDIKKKLFRELCRFLYRVSYLETKPVQE